VHIDIRDVNEAPVATALCDQTAAAGSHFSLETASHFSDVDRCDQLTYSISGPDWLTIDPHTGVISGNVPAHLATQEIAICDGHAALPSSGVLHLETDYLYGYAGYDNSVGYYIADADGNPIGGAIIETNAHQYGHHDTFIDLGQYPGAVSLGFFIIQDGANTYSGLSDGTPVTFTQVNGQWIGSANGLVLNKDAGQVLFSDQDLNANHYDHLKTAPGAQMGWEDLWQGGDKDFDDVAMNAKLQLIQLTPDDCDQTVTVTATDKGGLTAETNFQLDLTTANASFDSYQAGNGGANLLIGNGSSNVLSGGGGNDTLIGGPGHDYLIGGAGNDTLHGGLGSDILIGGDGSDRFVFNDLHDLDTVQGGSGNSWTDVIDLSGLPSSVSHDWTLVLTQGSILSQTAHDIVLSTDAQGAIHVDGETRIAFHGIENIHM
jgi:large repetitive protein